MVQRHLTDNLKKKRVIVPDHVNKDLGFSIMSRISAYQQQKQDFSTLVLTHTRTQS